MNKVIDVPRSTQVPPEGSPIRSCTNCVMLSTRPRIEFDDRGRCNACVWADEKQTIVDWDGRWKKLEALCDRFRKRDGFDVLVGVSGGKDGSYVAHMLKNKLGMHPLCITLSSPLSLELGNANLERFKGSGFDHIQVSPNPKIMRALNKKGLIEQGRPLFGWQIALQTALLRTTVAFRIPFLMYGEDGEVEYGGSSESKNQWSYQVSYAIRVYLSGHDPIAETEALGQWTAADLAWWQFPNASELNELGAVASHWSYFENWNPYHHYLLAKEQCGLQEREDASAGTYTNFAQTDTLLFDLHMYMMYLKFGFGRCTQDVGIDIRRGAMSRQQAKELVKVYDWQPPPENYVDEYLAYYEMTRGEFDAVLDKWANKSVLKKENGVWKPSLKVL